MEWVQQRQLQGMQRGGGTAWCFCCFWVLVIAWRRLDDFSFLAAFIGWTLAYHTCVTYIPREFDTVPNAVNADKCLTKLLVLTAI